MRGRKAFLFTFVTIFLLFSLLVLSYNYLQRNKQSQEFLAGLTQSNRANFLKEDVVSNYYAMLDIDLDGIDRNSSYIVLKFSNFSTFKSEPVYPGYLEELEDFVENEYSNMSNVHINLEKFTPEFELYPYNTSFVVDSQDRPDEFFIKVNDFAKFKGIMIDIKVNSSVSILNKTEVPTEDAPSDPLVHVRVFDMNNTQIMESRMHLDSTEENEEFKVAFNKIVSTTVLPTQTIIVLQNLTFSYGKFRKINIYGNDVLTNATFHLKATGIEADVERLHMNYTLTNKKAVLQTKGQMFIR